MFIFPYFDTACRSRESLTSKVYAKNVKALQDLEQSLSKKEVYVPKNIISMWCT